jgi:hypothetical protein
MNVSRDEAQKALSTIDEVMSQTRRDLGRGVFPYYMILWGAAWFLGYLLSYLLPVEYLSWIWPAVTLPALLMSFLLSLRRGEPVQSPMRRRISRVWLAIFGYGGLVLWIAEPTSGEQFSTLIVISIMLAYVVVGLMMQSAAFWVGLIITAMSLIGYYLLQPYYSLWIAFLGGGTLMVSGVYILRRWK